MYYWKRECAYKNDLSLILGDSGFKCKEKYNQNVNFHVHINTIND